MPRCSGLPDQLVALQLAEGCKCRVEKAAPEFLAQSAIPEVHGNEHLLCYQAAIVIPTGLPIIVVHAVAEQSGMIPFHEQALVLGRAMGIAEHYGIGNILDALTDVIRLPIDDHRIMAIWI